MFLIPSLTLSLPRVINFNFTLQPHQKKDMTWLFIAYSDERWLYYQFSLPHLYNSLYKVAGERTLVSWEWKELMSRNFLLLLQEFVPRAGSPRRPTVEPVRCGPWSAGTPTLNGRLQQFVPRLCRPSNGWKLAADPSTSSQACAGGWFWGRIELEPALKQRFPFATTPLRLGMWLQVPATFTLLRFVSRAASLTWTKHYKWLSWNWEFLERPGVNFGQWYSSKRLCFKTGYSPFRLSSE